MEGIIMKKIIIAIAIVLTMSFSASAQTTDGYFTTDMLGNDITRDVVLPMLPVWGVGVFNGDVAATAPLGEGLLILTALGAGYTVIRRKKK